MQRVTCSQSGNYPFKKGEGACSIGKAIWKAVQTLPSSLSTKLTCWNNLVKFLCWLFCVAFLFCWLDCTAACLNLSCQACSCATPFIPMKLLSIISYLSTPKEVIRFLCHKHKTGLLFLSFNFFCCTCIVGHHKRWNCTTVFCCTVLSKIMHPIFGPLILTWASFIYSWFTNFFLVWLLNCSFTFCKSLMSVFYLSYCWPSEAFRWVKWQTESSSDPFWQWVVLNGSESSANIITLCIITVWLQATMVVLRVGSWCLKLNVFSQSG